MMLLYLLALAAGLDGAAAHEHASRLAALGPHPWGSPRNSLAAQYVASQFRDAGLQEVRLQPFESQGIVGQNVIGVLRAPGPDFVLVGAHHDTAPEAPGAYDDGGGVGVLIEAARVLARDKQRQRSLVFVSFDGEEAWSTGKTTTAGSRAYLKALGGEARNLSAALVVEMCGWKGGTPAFQPIAYADPLRPGASVVAPAWLIERASAAARRAGAPFVVGDPWIPWLYQATVRTFRADMYGDDLSFLQAGLPALFVSDSSFSAFYPWYHTADDTADKVDAASLTRFGTGVLAMLRDLETAPRGPAAESHWFAASGFFLGPVVLFGLAALSTLPGLRLGMRLGGAGLGARLVATALFGYLFFRHPVPALFVFLLPNLAPLIPRRRTTVALALVPVVSLAGLGALAWYRGFVHGVWLSPWELVATALALGLALLPGGGSGKTSGRPGRAGRRKGLPAR
jgi:aminopeptidase YwaD